MKTRQSVINSLDAHDIAIYPFLPYIFQDLWELGADADGIIRLIEKHMERLDKIQLLDLGCGKGPVSIKLAKKYNCRCHGIDALPGFIDEAKEKARKWEVDHLCNFEVGDIRDAIGALSGFDVIVLGAIGPVLGDYHATLGTLANCLEEKGIVIIDDGYIRDDGERKDVSVQSRESIISNAYDAGFDMIDEVVIDREELKEKNREMFERIKLRCLEAARTNPGFSQVFHEYIAAQAEENERLESDFVCSLMVFGRV